MKDQSIEYTSLSTSNFSTYFQGVENQIIPNLAFFLDIKTLNAWCCTSSYYRNLLALALNGEFWKKKASCLFSDERFASIIDYEKSIKDYQNVYLTLLQTPRLQKKTSFFKPDSYYFIIGYYFDLKSVHRLLLQDDPNGLIDKVSRLKAFMPYFFSADFEAFYTAMEKLGIMYQEKDPEFVWQIEDWDFTNFLLPAMKARAIECFDLILRIFFMAFAVAKKKFKMDSVLNPILEFNDRYFIQKFIHLTIIFFKKETQMIAHVLHTLCINGQIDAIKSVLPCLTKEEYLQTKIICQNNSVPEHFLAEIFPLYNVQKKLEDKLYEALAIIRHNVHMPIEELGKWYLGFGNLMGEVGEEEVEDLLLKL